MAEEKQQKSAAQTAQTAAGKAKDAAKLAVDIGRIAAGDLSAIKDVLKNKLFWEIILVFAVTISLVGMIIGASITGVINYLSESWSQNWEENKLDQAINSNGNITQYKTTGWLLTLGNTVSDVISDLYNGITTGAIMEGKGSSDNSQIGDPDIEAAGRNPQAEDFQTTMEAIHSSAALTQALTDRLDMIKGRVLQRGLQIEKKVNEQYIDGKHSAYNEIAGILQDQMDSAYQSGDSEKMYFYAGFDETLSQENIHFDTSAFELSDLQALKILAIFCIQHDCQLTEMDMWTLMDYCGWYDNEFEGSLDDIADSIYETTSETHLFGSDIGTVVDKNMPILNWEFETLEVPVWTGTCAPQWYYEQLAQIRQHNSQYLALKEAGKDTTGLIPWGITVASDASRTSYTLAGSLVTEGASREYANSTEKTWKEYVLAMEGGTVVETRTGCPAGQPLHFTDLTPGTNYQISEITYLQTFYKNGTSSEKVIYSQKVVAVFQTETLLSQSEAENSIDVSRFDQLGDYETFGIIDKLFYSAENNLTINRKAYSSTTNYSKSEIEALRSPKIYKYWEKYIWGRSKSTFCGTVARDDNGNHSYTYSGFTPSDSYTSQTNEKTGERTTTSVSYSLYLSGGSYQTSGTGYTWTNLSGKTRYSLYRMRTQTTRKYDAGGKLLSTSTSTSNTWLDSFTTFENKMEAEAYELYLEIKLSFKARTVDEIAFDLLGIWPGDLTDTVQVIRTTSQGNLVGQGTKDTDSYEYCLKGGTFDLKSIAALKPLVESGAFPVSSIYMPLMRPYSVTEETTPLRICKYNFEYGITESSRPISSNNPTPQSGWRTVDANGDRLVFDIDPNKHYLLYARWTATTEILNSTGTVSKSQEQGLFIIDEIHPNGPKADTPVENDTLYAAGHLGDEGMRLTWTDTLTQNGTSTTLSFTRQTGYQYETYVDMVMALCELLKVDYTGWEPALERAEELGLRKPA